MKEVDCKCLRLTAVDNGGCGGNEKQEQRDMPGEHGNCFGWC